jgi:hypothetical protein
MLAKSKKRGNRLGKKDLQNPNINFYSNFGVK